MPLSRRLSSTYARIARTYLAWAPGILLLATIIFVPLGLIDALTAFIFPIALYGACRIGKPRSAWARRRYGERRPEKQAKSKGRFPPDRRTERFKNAFRDIVGGKPSEGIAAAREEAFAATREASHEVRQRAERITRPHDRKPD